MALLVAGAFVGVQIDNSGFHIGGPIKAAQLVTIAEDQGFAWETLTNTSALNGTSVPSVATPHIHSEAGNLIYRSLFTQHFGTNGRMSNYGLETNQQCLTIHVSPSATPVTINVLAALFFVPRGFQNTELAVIIDTGGADAPNMLMDLYDDTMAEISGYTSVPLSQANNLPSPAAGMMVEGNGGSSIYGAVFQVPAAGLYVLKLTTDYVETQGPKHIHSMHVFGVIDPSIRGPQLTLEPPTVAIPNVSVGDPDSSNAWQPIDGSTVINTDGPLNAMATLALAQNTALLAELATDLPAPGATAKTIAKGHDHSGTGQMGPEIEACHWAKCYGTWDLAPVAFGNNSRALLMRDNADFAMAAKGNVWLPVSSKTTGGGGGNSTLKAAALVYASNAKGGGGEIRIGIDGNTGTKSITDNGLLEVVKVLNPYGFTNGDSNEITIELKADSTLDEVYCLAVCIYNDP